MKYELRTMRALYMMRNTIFANRTIYHAWRSYSFQLQSKRIGILNSARIFIGLFISWIIFAPVALAALPSSASFKLQGYSFGSGGATNSTSTSFKINGIAGEIEFGQLSSTSFKVNSGLTYLMQANVPAAPTISNESSLDYNKLKIILSPGTNPSDYQYAVAISPDAFVSTTKYMQADGTLGASAVWQTNTLWGATGFYAIGLTPNITYSVKVAARQGNFTQSAFGPTAAATTAQPSFSFALNNNAVTFPNLDPGTVKTSTTTVTATVGTNGSGGAIIAASDSNAGLLSSNTSYTISAISSDLSTAAEGYGLRATTVGQSSGGPMESIAPYNGSGNNVGLLSSTKRNVFDSTSAPVTSGTGTFELQAKAGNTAKEASDYADIITVVASATF